MTSPPRPMMSPTIMSGTAICSTLQSKSVIPEVSSEDLNSEVDICILPSADGDAAGSQDQALIFNEEEASELSVCGSIPPSRVILETVMGNEVPGDPGRVLDPEVEDVDEVGDEEEVALPTSDLEDIGED